MSSAAKRALSMAELLIIGEKVAEEVHILVRVCGGGEGGSVSMRIQ